MIFQPDRYLLRKQIKAHSYYIKGVVLDAGSGETGRYKNFFKFDKYITLDVRPDSNADIIGSVENIPIEEGAIDSIISTQVLEHIKNPAKAVHEFYRVLKPGGYCLVTAPQLNELHEEPRDYFRFTKYGLEEIFKDSGFKIILIEKRGGFWAANTQMRTRYIIDLFDLNCHTWLAKIFNIFLIVGGHLSIVVDKLDKSKANEKNTLGWLIIGQK